MLWPSVGPSGSDFYGNTSIPGWQNSLLIANLKKGTVSRYKLSNDGLSIISDTIHYFRGLGRFRDVVVSPDGLKIYVACDSSGSTSGPTGGSTTTPANPGSILEFTYVPGGAVRKPTNNELRIEENTRDKTIDVYPNPATHFIVVYNYTAEAGRIIELADMGGRIVKRQLVNNLATRVEVADLPNGLYILKVTGTNGKLLRTEKIVIQK